MTLYLLKYNNYYNRIAKKLDTINEYDEYMIGVPVYRVNFNPADGIATEQIINWDSSYPNPDYAIVVNDDNDITSRWFVMEQTRTRSGQYRLMLRRDVIADNYNDILNAPAFIEKARLATSNPLIHNSESMTYNQILTDRTLLKDESGVPWVIGFVARNYAPPADTPIPVVARTDNDVDIVVSNILGWDYYQYTNLNPAPTNFHPYPRDPYLTVRFSQPYTDNKQAYRVFNVDSYMNQNTNYTVFASNRPGSAADYYPLTAPDAFGIIPFLMINNQDLTQLTQSIFNNLRTSENWESIRQAMALYSGTVKTRLKTESFRALQGKTILDQSTGVIYNIEIEEGDIDDQYKADEINISTASGNALRRLLENAGGFETYNFDNATFGWSTDERPLTLKLSTAGADLSVVPTANRYNLEDAPYDMFAVPAGEIKLTAGTSTETIESSIEAAIAIGTAIGENSGSAGVYDLQLVPYCPIRYMLGEAGNLLMQNHPSWIVRDSNGITRNRVFWAVKSSFKFQTPSVAPLQLPSDPIEYKVQNECDFKRLVSPNGNGVFEFRPTKNGGVSGIDIDVTYKPFNPHIHIKPVFGGLYGANYDKDFRGLICGGDFSITQLSNAWANYQQNNVNYQKAFDRQIENLEINNSIQRTKDIAGAIFGAAGAGTTGGMTGALVGGPVGAAIGAGVSGVASAAGGIIDYQMNELMRAETLDYTKDQFGYQLGNIRAIPSSLARVSALSYANTIFPVLESYTCTDAEKYALRNKLYYNGMTVMATGTIRQYMWKDLTYIKGKLIRCETLADDYHMLAEIARELDKGVFI